MESLDQYNFRIFRPHNLFGKKYRNVIVLICTLFPAAGLGQEKVPDWWLRFSGYVKNDIFYDTRQSNAATALRDEHFYLYPDNALYDEFGHDMGDAVLQRFSQIAKSKLRKNDIIARFGGDEFVMILTNASLKNAELVLSRIKDEFNEWAVKKGLPVGVSFGMGTTREGENNLDDVLRRVDAVLYEEKRKTGHVR